MPTRKTRKQLDAEMNLTDIEELLPDEEGGDKHKNQCPMPCSEEREKPQVLGEESIEEPKETTETSVESTDPKDDKSSTEETEARPEPENSTLDLGVATRLKTLIESLFFAASEPLSIQKLTEITQEVQPNLTNKTIRKIVEDLRDDLREQGRGIRVAEIGSKFQLRTPSESGPYVRKLVSTRPPRLTKATLETLSIVAYRQPVTRPEVEDIRGVDCGAVLKHLLEKKLVKILGRKDEPGRPILYATTSEFLSFFGLKDLKSLPTLKDFVELSDEHRAQLGLGFNQETAKEPALSGDGPILPSLSEDVNAFSPVGRDKVIEELSEVLADVKKKDRDLKRSEKEIKKNEENTQGLSPNGSPTEISSSGNELD
jgi:segregation and condensation protein B